MNIYQKIVHQVVSEGVKTVTFDVFDTLVFRHLAQPSQLFEMLNDEVFKAAHINKRDYGALRINAETRARQCHLEREDIRFEQIFEHMPFSTAAKQAFAIAECEAEKRFSVLNEALLEVIDDLQKRGIQIGFISDMYFSQTQIQEIFFHSYPSLHDIPLYVSSECGVTKQSGKLFLHVAESRHWHPGSWLHIGDNIDSDVNAARLVGIKALHFALSIDAPYIVQMERALCSQLNVSNAVRTLSCLSQSRENEIHTVASDLGGFVWGPVMHAFAHWLYEQCIHLNVKQVVCVMREGYFFSPLLAHYFALQGNSDIKVNTLYVSRLSAFWASIDTDSHEWLEKTIATVANYNGYTLKNFIDDFNLSPDEFAMFDLSMTLQSIDDVVIHGSALYDVLLNGAKKQQQWVENKVAQQKSLFKKYVRQNVTEDFAQCAIVDLGDGGTIQHSLENIFCTQAKANFLFFATQRIYRFIDSTHYRSFLPPDNRFDRISERLARSPECIEALLLGDEGSTLSYREVDNHVVPVTGTAVAGNGVYCEQFKSACLSYLSLALREGIAPPDVKQVAAIIKRYIMLPSCSEAALFEYLTHQDNFGTDNEFSVVDASQKLALNKNHEIAEAIEHIVKASHWQKGRLHWPAALIALKNDKLIPQALGLINNDLQNCIYRLVRRLKAMHWNEIAVYGAGEFFIALAPHLKTAGIKVSHLIDRKAELGHQYSVSGYSVQSLDQVLLQGIKRYVVASMAFQQEIVDKINREAVRMDRHDIDIISPNPKDLH
ncbi:HAD-IA family hydrolase [Alteromonas sp. 14N.309.X.WAT.G.H12]|uniref:HAD family hydrolase n=1 Tax=Alteromonas sp. 14N.309.X.WAT.G.H12 TaxID=3120824 RepID=UPI002FD70914